MKIIYSRILVQKCGYKYLISLSYFYYKYFSTKSQNICAYLTGRVRLHGRLNLMGNGAIRFFLLKNRKNKYCRALTKKLNYQYFNNKFNYLLFKDRMIIICIRETIWKITEKKFSSLSVLENHNALHLFVILPFFSSIVVSMILQALFSIIFLFH